MCKCPAVLFLLKRSRSPGSPYGCCTLCEDAAKAKTQLWVMFGRKDPIHTSKTHTLGAEENVGVKLGVKSETKFRCTHREKIYSRSTCDWTLCTFQRFFFFKGVCSFIYLLRNVDPHIYSVLLNICCQE